MSQWALDKLVDDSNKWGVFAIKYRTVDCKATLSNPAPYIPIVPDPHAGQNPGINCANVGGSSTTESSSIARAQLRRPTPRPTKHSRKYWARRRVSLPTPCPLVQTPPHNSCMLTLLPCTPSTTSNMRLASLLCHVLFPSYTLLFSGPSNGVQGVI